MILCGDEGGICTDPPYPYGEKEVKNFAKGNLELLEEYKVIREAKGYFGWEDLPEDERKKYQKRFAEIMLQKGPSAI